MLNKFISYYKTNNLFEESDRILLAVSGGKDSMVMLHLFNEGNNNFGVAHCNFQLREDEADKDEGFVKNCCDKRKIPFYSIRFDTVKYAEEHQLSIQMAARELRYQWFEKIRMENKYQYIATAHHKNDVAETILINLTKGTGLSGLHGIKNKTDAIIRPLLCFDREAIDAYIEKHQIPYREDQSNSATKYTRNAIRHNVIPELEKINPSLIKTLNEEAARFADLELILTDKIESEKMRCFNYSDSYIKIEIKALLNLSPLKTYLYYFLKEFDFNFSDVEDIIQGLKDQSGKTYYSSTYEMIKDRDYLMLRPIKEYQAEKIKINTFEAIPFDHQLMEIDNNFTIKADHHFAYFDADKVKFPLELRNWEYGDAFQPYGMNGNKKVSDFLIDNKVSVFDKKNTKVLLSGKQIIWLVGHRIDDRFKITSETKEALILLVK